MNRFGCWGAALPACLPHSHSPRRLESPIQSARRLNTGPNQSDIHAQTDKEGRLWAPVALKFLAEHPETPALSAKDIADGYGIPAQLLAKILQRLTKTGLLRSHAGMNGGYALARDARQISAFEVIHAIDGPLFITTCTKGAKGCDLTPSCTIKEPLARVNDTISGVLKSISIYDLAERELRPWFAADQPPRPCLTDTLEPSPTAAPACERPNFGM